ncbi:uncharacterized protein RJT20DRAFT_128019 [Scheffersomyces xylosifermentans]|uniref:uncharacterized protein n=1 Tax=Scheffersomyces xylosifermentans TaxID=1304137 RepID=UPI00315CED69
MYIPEIVPRQESTKDAFKSWNSCMKNNICKPIAVVCVVIGAIISLWIIIGLLRWLCMGLSCLSSWFCCCQSVNKKKKIIQGYDLNTSSYPLTAPPTYEKYHKKPKKAYLQNHGYERLMDAT